jgi:hypothetical protein
LKKKLNVLSLIAPFIAALASSAGATNSWYEIGSPPGPGMSPTRAPSPKPIESR